MSFTTAGVIPPIPAVHQDRPLHFNLSLDGKFVAYGTATGVVLRRLPEQETDEKTKAVEVFTGNKIPILSAAVSPDGLVVAGGDGDGKVHIWMRNKDGVAYKTHQLGMAYVKILSLSFSEDSKRVVVGGVDRYSKKLATCIFVDAGNALGVIEGHTQGIYSVDFRPRRPYYIASGGLDGNLGLHKGPPFKLAEKTEAHKGPVTCVKYSADASQLLTSGEDGKVKIWSPAACELQREIELSPQPIHSAAWSPSGHKIAAVGQDRQLRCYDLRTSAMEEYSLGDDKVHDTPLGVCWSKAGWIVVGFSDSRIVGFKIDNDEQLRPGYTFVWRGLTGTPVSVGSNLSAGRIIVGDSLGGLLSISTMEKEPKVVSAMKVPSPSMIRSIAMTSELGAAITNDGWLRIFRVGAGPVTVAVSPRGVGIDVKEKSANKITDEQKTLQVTTVTNGEDGDVKEVLDEVTWLGSHAFKEGTVGGVIVDNGKYLMVYCANGNAHCYPFQSSAVSTSLTPIWSTRLLSSILAASASADGSLVAVAVAPSPKYPQERLALTGLEPGKAASIVEMYEVTTGGNVEGVKFTTAYGLHASEVITLALNPAGTLLASCDVSRNIVVLQLETGQTLVRTEWRFHTAKITSMAWSPDGTKLATGSLDKDVYVWNTDEVRRRIRIKDAHQCGVTAVQFMFDNVLLSAGQDGVLSGYELTYD